jgi:hypothetical protein
VRNALHIEATSGNEYCLLAKIRLPNSQHVNIANIYLPPTSSLAKRDITEAHATAQLENALEPIQPQLLTILCGDFNARTGTLVPTLDIPHPPRTACDSHICPRAKWLLSLCTLFQLYILATQDSPPAFTCHSGRGESTVDYILCNHRNLQASHYP